MKLVASWATKAPDGGIWIALSTGMEMKHILVLVDFSVGSDASMARAVAIARKAGCRLTAAHAYGPVAQLPDELLESISREAGNALQAQCAQAEADGVPAMAWLHPGSPTEALEEAEITLSPDLVVIGAKGHSAMHRLWLGSTAEAVVRHASCPVLVVRGESEAQLFGRLLWASDGSPDSGRAWTDALALTAEDPDLHVIHVAGEVTETDAEEGRLAAEPVREKARSDLASTATELHAAPHFVEGFADVEISALAQRLDCDLIAIGARGMSTHRAWSPGGTATRVLRRANCSVLVSREASGDAALEDAAHGVHAALGDLIDQGEEGARELRATVREVTRLAHDARDLEDEMLEGLIEAVREQVALLEADHPFAAEALSRFIRQLARLGI